MANSKLMWITTFRIFSHPCAVADVMRGLCADMSSLEFVVGIAYTIDLLAVLIIDVVSAIGVEMLANDAQDTQDLLRFGSRGLTSF